MYKMGETVVYPMHGIGVIESIDTKEILGEKREFYVVRILYSNTTFLIPVSNAPKTNLRKLMTQKDIERALHVLELPPKISNNWRERKNLNNERMKRGSLSDLAEVIRDLYYQNKIKELSINEKRLYENAYNFMASEIASIMGVSEEEASHMIAEHLEILDTKAVESL